MRIDTVTGPMRGQSTSPTDPPAAGNGGVPRAERATPQARQARHPGRARSGLAEAAQG